MITAVCSFYGATADALRSKRRDKGTVKARHVAIYLLREVAMKNLREIGSLLGHRDHATIRYSWVKISGARESDASIRSDIDRITDMIAA